MSFFLEGKPVNIRWVTTGARTVTVQIDNRDISDNHNGSTAVTDRGSHNVEISASYDTDIGGTLKMYIDNQLVSDLSTSRVRKHVVPQPCMEYIIDNARSTCKNGYRKISREMFRYHTRLISGVGSRRRTTRSVTDWTSIRNPRNIPDDKIGNNEHYSHSGGHSPTILYYERIESKSTYYCTPESGCTDGVETDQAYNVGNLNDDHDFTVADSVVESPAVVDPDKGDSDGDDSRRSRVCPVGFKMFDGKCRSDYEIEQILKKRSSVTVEPIEDTLDTKYRIISPLVYDSLPDGRKIEQLRYESVRMLSPDAVASYVKRGYTLESINPDTPLSYSKPYGKSVLVRSETLHPLEVTLSKYQPRRLPIQRMAVKPKTHLFKPAIHKREIRRRISE